MTPENIDELFRALMWSGSVPDKLEPCFGPSPLWGLLYAGQQRVAYNLASPEPPEHLGQNDNRSLAELGIAWEEPTEPEEQEEPDEQRQAKTG